MLATIKEIRKKLTTLELEIGAKHPDTPNLDIVLDTRNDLQTLMYKLSDKIEEVFQS